MSKQYVTVETPIGTRVKCVGLYDNEYVVGKEGVIVGIDSEDCMWNLTSLFLRGAKTASGGSPQADAFSSRKRKNELPMSLSMLCCLEVNSNG